MSQNITTEILFSKLQSEKSIGELLPLQKNFYTEATTFIKELREGGSEEKNKQAENAKKIIITLKERRKQKLLIYLAYNKQLPQSMPEEEEALYNEIRKILNKDTSDIKISRLKITKNIPEVITAEGRKVGPYKEGEVIEVSDNGDMEFIVKNKIGETVNQ